MTAVRVAARTLGRDVDVLGISAPSSKYTRLVVVRPAGYAGVECAILGVLVEILGRRGGLVKPVTEGANEENI